MSKTVLVPSDENTARKLEEVCTKYGMEPVCTIYSNDNGEHVIVLTDIRCPYELKKKIHALFGKFDA